MTSVTRGCGKPQVGGLYLNIGTSLYGTPLDEFLIDPTVPVLESLNIPAMGMKVLATGEKNAADKPIYYVFDHIGSEHYPNVMDWFMETQEHGFHRRISSNFPFHLLTEESKYFAIHSNAGILNPKPYAKEFKPTHLINDKCGQKHDEGKTCIHFLTNDLQGSDLEDGIDRHVRVVTPSVSYEGYSAPVNNQKYIRSIFMVLPIGKMANFKFYDDGSKQVSKKRKEIEQKIPQFMGMEVENV